MRKLFKPILLVLGGAAVITAAPRGARAQEGAPPPPEGQPATPPPEGMTAPVCPPGATSGPPGEICPPPQAEQPPPEPTAMPTERQQPRAERRWHVFRPSEVAVVAGAGVTNYFGGGMGPTDTDPGANWGARVTIGTRSIIALEASYIGAFNTLNGPGTKANLSSEGFDGDFRLNLTPAAFPVQPYVFSGVGYNHMSVLRADNVDTTLSGEANQFQVPSGGGFSAYLGRHVTLDARGTYRFFPRTNLDIMSVNGDDGIHNWSADARIGYVF